MEKNYKLFIINLILLFLAPLAVDARSNTDTNTNQPPNIGNFALPTSQQPGPLISFGQNIIDKGQLQFFLAPDYLKVQTQHFLTTTPSLLYGIYDNASLYLTLPLALNYRNGIYHSSGLADAGIQLEYAFYEASNTRDTKQATFVAGTTLPTGSLYKTPPTGISTPSFFLGSTYNVTFVDWLWFVSPGALLIPTHNRIKLGSQYYYEFGIGRNFFSVPNKYIVSGLLELNGVFTEKNTIFGYSNPNSGGNIIGITPSLWFSTKRLIVQLGITLPLIQHLNGDQSKTNYLLTGNFSWTFNE